MLIVLTDPTGRAVSALDDFTLDISIGDSDNDFELSIPADAPRLESGCIAYVPGTELGGVVDDISSETDSSGTTLSYEGRSWSGILANRIVLPSASGYFESEGEANACIRALIAHLGLGGVFSVPMSDSGILLSYRWERFCDAWHGLMACLKSSGAKPVMRHTGSTVELSAAPSESHGNGDGRISFSIKRKYRPVNHLVCAGSGKMQDRAVVHFYADSQGNVSHVQSLFGLDEVSALYDYTNASEDELEEQGAKKLSDYQVQGEVKVSVGDGPDDFDIGDTLVGREDRFGIEVAAEVVGKVVTVSRGQAVAKYKCGQASSTKSLSASSESSGSGGHAYYAGEGLTLTGYTFSADVTSDDISRIEEDVSEAMGAASDAAAEAARSVKGVSASGFITVSRESGQVTIGAETVTASEVNKWFS